MGFDNNGTLGGTPFFGKEIVPDPTKEYVAAGPGRWTPKIPQIIESEFDDVTCQFGFRVLEAMLTDPAVNSAYLALKLSILAGPLQVQPSIRPKGYRDGQSFNVDDSKAKVSPQEKRSIEIAEFCKRDLNRNKRNSIKSSLNQLLDKMVYGCKVAEKTRVEVKFGPDKGKLGLDSLNVKPYWAWKFVVDSAMVPRYLLTWLPPEVKKSPYQGGYALIPINKFIHATWLPKDGDPRGTSCLRPAYDWWNLKRQCMPFYYQHLRRFGSPSLDGELAPGDTVQRFPIDPTTGLEMVNQPKVGPVQHFTQALIAFQNNSVIVRPAGSALNVLEPRSDGEAFLKAFDLFDRAIVLSIGMQTRASLEAKHGSKADSETAQDTMSLVTMYGKEELGAEVTSQLFYESVFLNFGEDAAEEFCPQLMVGKVEQQDRAAMWTAASSCGYTFGPSQMTELDAMLDAPERDADADLAQAQDAMQHQAEIMAASKPQPGEPGAKPGAGQGGSDKPAAKPDPSGGQTAKPKPVTKPPTNE